MREIRYCERKETRNKKVAFEAQHTMKTQNITFYEINNYASVEKIGQMTFKADKDELIAILDNLVNTLEKPGKQLSLTR